MAEFQSPFVPGLPRFTGGAVGYSRLRRRAVVRAGVAAPAAGGGADATTSDAGFMLFDTVLAFDHVQHRILIIANARITATRTSRRSTSSPAPRSSSSSANSSARCRSRAPTGRAAARRHVELHAGALRGGVRTAKEHIAAGDVYQVVLSQRFETATRRRSVHRLPRAAAREPVALHVLHPDGRRRSSARRPRCWCGSRDARRDAPDRRHAPRGATDEEDLRLAEELKRNEKERAEHVMLVDLGRNDLGRVCEYGTVRVPQYMALERYSHVMHLVSVVEGRWPTTATGSTRSSRASRPARCRARRRCARCRSSRRSSRRGAALRRRGRLPRLRGQPRLLHRHPHDRHRTGVPTCRPAPASSPTRTRRAEYEETRDKARALLRRSNWRRRDCEPRGARHRQLRLVHLQPGAVPRRARRGGAVRATTRSRSTRSRRAAPTRDRDLAGPGPARGRRHLARGDPRVRPTRADARRVPRAPGHRRRRSAAGGARAAPMHGKTSRSSTTAGRLPGLWPPFEAGRYHSLSWPRTTCPRRSRSRRGSGDDGTVMGCGTASGRCTACSSTPSRC
jgi:hypothetical protein